MAARVRVLVIADADSALARPSPPACAEAGRVLRHLESHGAALVLCSTKTRAEMEQIQHDLGIAHPFIAEGGSAVFVPARYFPFPVPSTREVAGYHAIELGVPYEHVVHVLEHTASRQRVPILSFNNMSVEDVARECGLSLLQARLAKLRDYAEPFRLVHPDEPARQRLIRALASANLHCVASGQFDYVGGSKGFAPAVSALRRLYVDACPGLVVTRGAASPAAVDPLAWARSIVSDASRFTLPAG